jgi:hypothetical protein
MQETNIVDIKKEIEKKHNKLIETETKKGELVRKRLEEK